VTYCVVDIDIFGLAPHFNSRPRVDHRVAGCDAWRRNTARHVRVQGYPGGSVRRARLSGGQCACVRVWSWCVVGAAASNGTLWALLKTPNTARLRGKTLRIEVVMALLEEGRVAGHIASRLAALVPLGAAGGGSSNPRAAGVVRAARGFACVPQAYLTCGGTVCGDLHDDCVFIFSRHRVVVMLRRFRGCEGD